MLFCRPVVQLQAMLLTLLLMTQTNVHKISWLYVALVSGFIFHSVDTSNFVVTRVSSGKQFRLQRGPTWK